MSSITLPRPAERVAIVSLVLVFLCGGVTGAMLMSYVVHPHIHPTHPGVTQISITEWKSTLDLSDEQTRQLTSILDDFSHYYDNLMADGNSRVRQILSPEQTRKYERMMQNHKP